MGVTSMEFIKGYRYDDDLRRSFNDLAMKTFGIEFEDWYEAGYWTDKYIPYSFVENGKVIANVSVNIVQLIIDRQVVPAVQIGTVMTDKEYRNLGLSRLLMEKVLSDYQHIEIMYLFANETVLEFYPKFGFERMEETLYSVNVNSKGKNKPPKIKDFNFIYEYASRRGIFSHFGTSSTEELLLFYVQMVFTNDVYFLEQDSAIVICKNAGSALHLYDVISEKEVNLFNIIDQLSNEETLKAVFHFTPELADLNMERYQEGNVLFVRNKGNFKFPKHFKHPITSQA